MVQEQGTIPPSLTEEKLRGLVVEAINDGSGNPETYHALYGHVDRGLHTNDVIHGLNENGPSSVPPYSTRDFGSGNITSTLKVPAATR
jgi:hypothetical protein